MAPMGNLLLILATILWGSPTAQSGNCIHVLIGMSPCMNYISGNSAAPSADCCKGLGKDVGSQPQCLCQMLNGGGSNLGVKINKTQAMAMPKACQLQTSFASLCNATSPPGSPGGGSRAAPSSSDATSTTLSTLALLVFSACYCYASIFNMV